MDKTKKNLNNKFIRFLLVVIFTAIITGVIGTIFLELSYKAPGEGHFDFTSWTEFWHRIVCGIITFPNQYYSSGTNDLDLCAHDFYAYISFLSFFVIIFAITICIWFYFKKRRPKQTP